MKSDGQQPADSIRLDVLSERISAELHLLLRLSLQLQDAMSCNPTPRWQEAQILGALQGIDRISQGLCDLAHLTEGIGLLTPASVCLERQPLDARLRLRDLSLRLRLHDEPPQDYTFGNMCDLVREPGDILLF